MLSGSVQAYELLGVKTSASSAPDYKQLSGIYLIYGSTDCKLMCPIHPLSQPLNTTVIIDAVGQSANLSVATDRNGAVHS